MSGTMMYHGARVPIEVSSSIPSFCFQAKRASHLVFPYRLATSKKEISYFLVKSHAKFYWEHCPRSMVLYVFSF